MTGEFEFRTLALANKKVSIAKDHGKNYLTVRPVLVHHLLRNCLFAHHSNDLLCTTKWVSQLVRTIERRIRNPKFER